MLLNRINFMTDKTIIKTTKITSSHNGNVALRGCYYPNFKETYVRVLKNLMYYVVQAVILHLFFSFAIQGPSILL